MRSIDYSARDHDVVDYELFRLPDVPDLQFRGPEPELVPGEYLTCFGAAQALGVLIERPYPTLLSDALDVPVLNLGLGGVSGSFLAGEERLLARASRGRAVVLQVVAARAEPNERFRPTEGVELLHDTVEGYEITTIEVWNRAFQDDRFAEYVEQSRRSWVAAYSTSPTSAALRASPRPHRLEDAWWRAVGDGGVGEPLLPVAGDER